MTIGQLIESLKSKVNTFYLSSESEKDWLNDATPFRDAKVPELQNMLKEAGYQPQGYEMMMSGFTGKMYQMRTFICPTRYQRLKHLVSDKIHSLSHDHDALTLKGWKPISTVTLEDEVACLRNGIELVYEHPTEAFAYPDYEGLMYYIKNQAIDLHVSGNHRMFVSKKNERKRIWLPYELTKAKDIVGKRLRYKKDAEWNVPDYQFILPAITKFKHIHVEERTVNMDAFLIFIGVWFSEGCAFNDNGTGTIWIATNKKRVKRELFPALDILEYKYNHYIDEDHSRDSIRIYDKQLFCYMKPFSLGAPHKELPDWVFELSQRQVKILIHGMVLGELGDGCFSEEGKEIVLYTTSVKLADQFQQLCLHAGYGSIVSTQFQKGRQVQIEGREVKSNYDLLKLSITTSRLHPTVNYGREQKIQEEKLVWEKCPVFCISVPSEVFYVRRNGKAVWTGNSRDRGPIEIWNIVSVEIKVSASLLIFFITGNTVKLQETPLEPSLPNRHSNVVCGSVNNRKYGKNVKEVALRPAGDAGLDYPQPNS